MYYMALPPPEFDRIYQHMLKFTQDESDQWEVHMTPELLTILNDTYEYSIGELIAAFRTVIVSDKQGPFIYMVRRPSVGCLKT